MHRLSAFFTLILIFAFAPVLKSQRADTLTIYFSIDSYTLSAEQTKSIKDILQEIDVKYFEINAYTDFLGSVDHNLQLSQKRADAVKQLLIANGVEQSEINTCSGKGIHQFSSPENRRNSEDRGILFHRKAEIIYYYSLLIPKKVEEVIDEVTEEKVVISAYGEQSTVIDLKNLTEDNLVEGEKILLRNINFKGGTPIFLEESYSALDELLDVMRKFPDLKIEIQGHICCQSPEEPDGYDSVNDNNYLSRNRAKAVYDFLIRSGVEPERMTYIGYGAHFKLYPAEMSSWEQVQNRRVEIKIIEK